jgi:hypothetical protein
MKNHLKPIALAVIATFSLVSCNSQVGESSSPTNINATNDDVIATKNSKLTYMNYSLPNNNQRSLKIVGVDDVILWMGVTVVVTSIATALYKYIDSFCWTNCEKPNDVTKTRKSAYLSSVAFDALNKDTRFREYLPQDKTSDNEKSFILIRDENKLDNRFLLNGGEYPSQESCNPSQKAKPPRNGLAYDDSSTPPSFNEYIVYIWDNNQPSFDLGFFSLESNTKILFNGGWKDKNIALVSVPRGSSINAVITPNANASRNPKATLTQVKLAQMNLPFLFSNYNNESSNQEFATFLNPLLDKLFANPQEEIFDKSKYNPEDYVISLPSAGYAISSIRKLGVKAVKLASKNKIIPMITSRIEAYPNTFNRPELKHSLKSFFYNISNEISPFFDHNILIANGQFPDLNIAWTPKEGYNPEIKNLTNLVTDKYTCNDVSAIGSIVTVSCKPNNLPINTTNEDPFNTRGPAIAIDKTNKVSSLDVALCANNKVLWDDNLAQLTCQKYNYPPQSIFMGSATTVDYSNSHAGFITSWDGSKGEVGVALNDGYVYHSLFCPTTQAIKYIPNSSGSSAEFSCISLPQPTGNYRKNCNNIMYNPVTTELNASCKNSMGVSIDSSISANQCEDNSIVNNNGNLECTLKNVPQQSLYLRFDVSKELLDGSYPKVINSGNWQGIDSVLANSNNYKAIFNDNSNSLFYILKSDGKVAIYDDAKRSITRTYNSISELFPNLNLGYEQIRSIWYNDNNSYGFLTSNNKFIIYDNNKKMITIKTDRIFSEFENKDIRFVSYAGNHHVYYFVEDGFNTLKVYQDTLVNGNGKLKYLGTLQDEQDISGDLRGLEFYQEILKHAVYRKDNNKLYFFTANVNSKYYVK